MEHSLAAPGNEALRAALRDANALSERYGLRLSEGQLQALADGRAAALADTGRVEFGPGVLPRLMYALCDSPYVDRQSYCDTLLALQEAFYYFKSDSGDAFSDEELVDALRVAFNGPAQGSAEYVCGLSPEELYRLWLRGEGRKDE